MLIIADVKLPHAEEAFGQFGEVRVLPTKQMNRENIKNADVIFVRSETKIDASLLDGTRVRFVGTATIGTDHVDLEYLKKNNIGFTSCPGSNANSVGEYVLAALLEVSHRLGFSLKGKTLGVVGYGNTGSRVAKKAEAIGMNVLLNDPPLARTMADPCYLPLDALMKADFISLHVPLTKAGEDATFHLFDEQRLAAMGKGSILINASRGAVVETMVLKQSLKSNHLKACVLDVWEGEPKIDIELLQMVMIGTPHIAGYSYDGKLNATTMLQQGLSKFVQRPLSARSQFTSEQVKEIRLTEDGTEPSLRQAVRQCYNIEDDDRRMRTLLFLPERERPNFFRRLRAEYPTRREFHNYSIHAEHLSIQTTSVLSSIGFKVCSTKERV